jgi:hypothetical protein
MHQKQKKGRLAEDAPTKSYKNLTSTWLADLVPESFF